uniref:Protein male abnormal 21 n=1 Tax=Lygus hesperus TaxID=30085 RepID=A0A0A9YEX5_LYGHE
MGGTWRIAVICVFAVSTAKCATLPQPSDMKTAQNQDPMMERDLQDLGLRKPGGSVAVMKTHSVIYKNINGEKEQYEQRKEEVQKNGEVVARVQQELDKSGQNQEPHVKTMLDIPAENLHRVIEHGPKRNDNVLEKSHRPLANNSRAGVKQVNRKPFSPLDMAEYVFWTGDERGATTAIEEFLEDGLMTRDEAIVFLEEIKENLENLKAQYAGEMERPKIQLVAQKYNIKK